MKFHEHMYKHCTFQGNGITITLCTSRSEKCLEQKNELYGQWWQSDAKKLGDALQLWPLNISPNNLDCTWARSLHKPLDLGYVGNSIFRERHGCQWHRVLQHRCISFGCPAAGPCAHKLCFAGLLVQKLLAGRLDNREVGPVVLPCFVMWLPLFPIHDSCKIHTTLLNHIEQSYCFEVEWYHFQKNPKSSKQ